MKILIGTKNPGKIEGAKQAFEKIGVPVTGVVVNKVPNIKSNYYTSYYE